MATNIGAKSHEDGPHPHVPTLPSHSPLRLDLTFQLCLHPHSHMYTQPSPSLCNLSLTFKLCSHSHVATLSLPSLTLMFQLCSHPREVEYLCSAHTCLVYLKNTVQLYTSILGSYLFNQDHACQNKRKKNYSVTNKITSKHSNSCLTSSSSSRPILSALSENFKRYLVDNSKRSIWVNPMEWHIETAFVEKAVEKFSL